jgi:thioredoxin-related protein
MEIAKQQIKEFGLNYPILWAEGESEENIAKNYGIRVFPTTYIIDKDGKVRLRLLGQQTKDFFEAKIKEIL